MELYISSLSDIKMDKEVAAYEVPEPIWKIRLLDTPVVTRSRNNGRNLY